MKSGVNDGRFTSGRRVEHGAVDTHPSVVRHLALEYEASAALALECARIPPLTPNLEGATAVSRNKRIRAEKMAATVCTAFVCSAECRCLLALQTFFTSRKADSAFSWWRCVYQVGAYFSRSSYSSASTSVARVNCSFTSSTSFGCRGKLLASDRSVRARVTFSLPPDGSSDTTKTGRYPDLTPRTHCPAAASMLTSPSISKMSLIGAQGVPATHGKDGFLDYGHGQWEHNRCSAEGRTQPKDGARLDRKAGQSEKQGDSSP